jgi:hypothetical protein
MLHINALHFTYLPVQAIPFNAATSKKRRTQPLVALKQFILLQEKFKNQHYHLVDHNAVVKVRKIGIDECFKF